MLKTFTLIFLILSNLLYSNEENTFQNRSESFKKLHQTIAIVEQFYIDEKEIDDLVNNSLKGLMTNLDPHSTFMSEKETKEMNVQTSGEFGGVGIVVTLKDKVLTIVSPIEDTPGFKAGLKTNDIIIKINDISTLDFGIDEAVKHMRGKPGTDLTLTIVREGEKEPLEIDITRAIIKVEPVKYKIYNKDGKKILILRITSFNGNTYSKMKEILDNNKDADGMILDLRNNPGGLLDQSFLVAQEFIEEGKVIVSQRGREGSPFQKQTDKEYKSTNLNPNKIPMVVLVNEGSASASEIVSGALQDHNRALIVGQKTFGKGTVQVVLPVNDTESIKLTIAKYYLPSGRTIQNKGIDPDFIVPQPIIEFKDKKGLLTESSLKNTLKEKYFDEEEKQVIDKKEDNEVSDEENDELSEEKLIKDYQLLIGIFKLQSKLY